MSNEEAQIKLPLVCSRTQKTRDMVYPLNEVQGLLERRSLKAANAAKIQAFIESIPANERPDMIAIYKGRGGVHANVDMKSDAIVARAFNEALNDEIFELPAPKVRKPRAKAVESVEVEAELDAE